MNGSFAAFIAGLLIEATAVVWVRAAADGRVISASVASMAQATAQVVGIGESLSDWRRGLFFVLGYGAGTALAMVLNGVRR